MVENGSVQNLLSSQHEDLNVEKWFLMSSPLPVLTILISYLVFVLKTGPDYMKKKKPFNLNGVLVFYNALQVIFSIVLFHMGCDLILRNGLISPRKCITESKDLMLYIAFATYYYFIAKVTELLDTVFFVLRKKNSQITFLHVYHHTIMVAITWSTLKYEPTYSTIFLGTINSFVHIVMYAYYGLSSFPGLAKYLWWKKYLTSMQMIQFLLIFAQAVSSYHTLPKRCEEWCLRPVAISRGLLGPMGLSYYGLSL
ncbi:unnamed protein product, partial [Iphiclides podalirius]